MTDDKIFNVNDPWECQNTNNNSYIKIITFTCLEVFDNLRRV